MVRPCGRNDDRTPSASPRALDLSRRMIVMVIETDFANRATFGVAARFFQHREVFVFDVDRVVRMITDSVKNIRIGF